jgi:membrane protease subunit HflK
MYLETMQGVLSQTDKVILDGQAGAGGAVPYLPLNELRRPQDGNPRPGSAAGGSGN